MVTAARTSRFLLTLLSTCLLLAACASGPPKPRVDYSSDYNFARVKRIAFYDESGQVIGSNPLQISDIVHERIDDALTYALQNKGIQIVNDAAQADLLLSWHLVTEEKTDIRTWDTPAYGYYNRYSRYSCWSCAPFRTEVTVNQYTLGTFIVDLIDPKLRKSVWRAVTQSRLRKDPSTDQTQYNETATAIFASFPPGQYTTPN
ncbi:MAG: DUF4136 domain-containing protein [Halioglobus sp.]|nr:DUF4136 domain-containing protein [Halioglobus sp.]